MRYALYWITVLVAVQMSISAKDTPAVCGYASCPTTKWTTINVHLVPHSHDDVGWLKTVDQYYYGTENQIQSACVQCILDSVVDELLKNSKRRFIYAESAFFFKWYNEQNDHMKKKINTLVSEGRFEFVGGAWSMNDEATTHYQSVIDQFTLGLQRLNETFGGCSRPRIGWQIDPFGHSREMASIFAQMGYDGNFFTRIDWYEKELRLRKMKSEMIWKASESLEERSEIFAAALYGHYSAPADFCFDGLCGDQQTAFIDGDSYDNNVKRLVDEFLEYVINLTRFYRASHILIPMGDDFHYSNAKMNFKNMDKLIRYVNNRQKTGSKVNVFYSTPSCYLNALHKEPITWPNKTQDFFPYSSDGNSYWTGFYTSRPTQKYYERLGNHFLQVVKQLTVLSDLPICKRLTSLKETMGVWQHHDSMPGTTKLAIANDYNRLLSDSLGQAALKTQFALQQLTNLTRGAFFNCWQLNISHCEYTQDTAKDLVITLFNPLAHPQYQYVRVPVPANATYEIVDETGHVFKSELVPIPASVLALPFRPKKTTHELVFEAYVNKLANYYVNVKVSGKLAAKAIVQETQGVMETEPKIMAPASQLAAAVPAMPAATDTTTTTTATGKVAAATAAETASDTQKPETLPSKKTQRIKRAADTTQTGNTVIQTSTVKVVFNRNGKLSQIQMNGLTANIQQNFLYYPAAVGDNSKAKYRSSGAYIFRPNGTAVSLTKKIALSVHQGDRVKEVHQVFNAYVSQVVRIYETLNQVEFEWLIGPISVADAIGKEIITQFKTSINNTGVFWTDSNGREMMQRKLNERESFIPMLEENVAGNYYPVTTRIAIQDDEKRLALLTDRSHGGTSLQNGAIELLLHRRLLVDDGFGVNEALNDTAIARGKHTLILSSVPLKQTVYERFAQQKIHLPFWKFFSNATYATTYEPKQIADFSSLPMGIQILTIEPYTADERLIRFENYLDQNETSKITFNIYSIFKALDGIEMREMTLDGSMELGDMRRFKFQPEGTDNQVEYYTARNTPFYATKKASNAHFTISLEPMEIRTFIIKWEKPTNY